LFQAECIELRKKNHKSEDSNYQPIISMQEENSLKYIKEKKFLKEVLLTKKRNLKFSRKVLKFGKSNKYLALFVDTIKL
jgi:hypothetical protein